MGATQDADEPQANAMADRDLECMQILLRAPSHNLKDKLGVTWEWKHEGGEG